MTQKHVENMLQWNSPKVGKRGMSDINLLKVLSDWNVDLSSAGTESGIFHISYNYS